jgi:hypothetical protein
MTPLEGGLCDPREDRVALREAVIVTAFQKGGPLKGSLFSFIPSSLPGRFFVGHPSQWYEP